MCKKTLFLVILCLVSAMLLLGCASVPGSVADAPAVEPTPLPAGAPVSGPITLTDMMGRTVTLDGPAQSVVALTASDCEILYAIGAGELLVGRGEYCDYPQEVLAVPSVESGFETNIEQILSLAPDVLIMATMNQPKEQVDALEAAGVHVIVSNAADIEGTYEAIRLIGAATGRSTEAEAVCLSMRQTFDAVAADKEKNTGKSVYFEVSPLAYGLWTAGRGTFMDEVAEMLGLTNCFADVEGWAEISEEQVIERNPDFIVTISMSFDGEPSPIEEILSRPGWENIRAVRNGAILNLTGNELSRPAPRLASGAAVLSGFVRAFDENAGLIG